MVKIYLIGHSNLPLEQFKQMLQRENITVLYDIRLMPFSRYVPQYNQTTLPEVLSKWGIEYKYRKDLGPRVDGDKPLYDKGGFNYDMALNRPRIIEGLKSIIAENKHDENIAIMATKREPLECHRFLVLTPVLKKLGYSVSHILPVETFDNNYFENKLIETLNRRIKRKTYTINIENDILYNAYFAQSEKIAKIGLKKFSALSKKISNKK